MPQGPTRRADKNVLMTLFAQQSFEDFDGAIAQWDAVLLARLHATFVDGPDPVVEIDFVPARTEHLGGPGRRQNAKLKRSRSGAFMLPQLSHEGWYLLVRQRQVVLLFTLWPLQQVLQMAFPLRGVLACA